MPGKSASIRRGFRGVRVEVETSLSFDVVRGRLSDAMGDATVEKVVALAGEVSSQEDYHREIERLYVGPSGFLSFAQIDHGAWISIYGINRRSIRWILGNPLIAITMIRQDLKAGLFVPIELLISETEQGGTSLVYVVPSSLIAIDDTNPPLAAAAQALDEKFGALIAQVTSE